MHPKSHSLKNEIGLHVITLFRYAVLCSGAITCYCLCYLAYEHYFHYCSYSVWNCTESQRQNEKIPWAIVIFIFTCVAATLESLFSTCYSLHMNQQRPNYAQLLVTTTPVTLLYLISYRMFFKLPSVKLPCPFGPNNHRNLKDAPETYDCCIAMGVIVAGGIALFFQAMITAIAATVVMSRRSTRKRIMLSEILSIVAAANTSDEKVEGDKSCEILVV